MKDFFGTELAIGDTVAILLKNYRSLCLGVIVQFHPKQMTVEYHHHIYGPSTYRIYPQDSVKKPSPV